MTLETMRPMEDLADRIFLYPRRTSSGALYARRVPSAVPQGKRAARRWLFDRLNQGEWPNGLSIVTMPGLHWQFEWGLLQSRETRKRLHDGNKVRRTFICALEREAPIYSASLRYIPGGRSKLTHFDSPIYAQQSVGTPCVIRYHLATAEEFLEQEDHANDVVWLDFNGPITERRLAAISLYWPRIRNMLVVTMMHARFSPTISDFLRRVGYEVGLESVCVGGRAVHSMAYFDTAPMQQVAVVRT